MGLLGTILGALNPGKQTTTEPVQGATASAERTEPTQGHAERLAGVISQLIQEHGGLLGLMDLFRNKGFGEEFSSWVGTGENKAIGPNQIQQVLGNEHVAEMAQRFGIDPGKASELLSQYLPRIVDKLTPQGRVEPGHDVEGGLASLAKGGLGKLLG